MDNRDILEKKRPLEKIQWRNTGQLECKICGMKFDNEKNRFEKLKEHQKRCHY